MLLVYMHTGHFADGCVLRGCCVSGLSQEPEDNLVHSRHFHAAIVVGISRLIPLDSLKVRREACSQDNEGQNLFPSKVKYSQP